ncbi:unnamed protein product [Auanema sp. JU1783]|nr:unnamed protein product [Auanema sp. JU1783]
MPSRQFFIFLFFFPTVYSESLLERLYSSSQLKVPRYLKIERHNQLNDEDAPIPPKAIDLIGSFRGDPIIGRQQNVLVDDNGVPVPIQPYFPDGRGKLPSRLYGV